MTMVVHHTIKQVHRAPSAQAGAAGAAAVVFDDAALAKLRELDPDGQRGFVPQVLRAFETSLERHLARLQPAADGSAPDARLAAEVAHTLKSSSAAVGALAFSACCSRLERSARGGELGDIVPALAELRAEGERVLAAVRDMLRA